MFALPMASKSVYCNWKAHFIGHENAIFTPNFIKKPNIIHKKEIEITFLHSLYTQCWILNQTEYKKMTDLYKRRWWLCVLNTEAKKCSRIKTTMEQKFQNGVYIERTMLCMRACMCASVGLSSMYTSIGTCMHICCCCIEYMYRTEWWIVNSRQYIRSGETVVDEIICERPQFVCSYRSHVMTLSSIGCWCVYIFYLIFFFLWQIG